MSVNQISHSQIPEQSVFSISTDSLTSIQLNVLSRIHNFVKSLTCILSRNKKSPYWISIKFPDQLIGDCFSKRFLKTRQTDTKSVHKKMAHFSLVQSALLKTVTVSKFDFYEHVDPDVTEYVHLDVTDQVLSENHLENLEQTAQELRTREEALVQTIVQLQANVERLQKVIHDKDLQPNVNNKVRDYHRYYRWSLVQIVNLIKNKYALRDENKNRQMLLEACVQDYENRQTQIQFYEEKFNALETEMAELKIKYQLLERDNCQKSLLGCDLKNHTESCKFQSKIHKSEVAQYQQMLELYQKRLAQLKHLSDMKTNQVSELETQVCCLQDQVKQVERNKVDTLYQLKVLKSTLDHVTSANEKITFDNLQLNFSTLTEMTEVYKELDTLKKTYEDVCASNERLAAKHIRSEKLIMRESKDNVQWAQSELTKVYEKVKQFQTELTQVHATLKLVEKEKADALSELNHLKSSHEQDSQQRLPPNNVQQETLMKERKGNLLLISELSSTKRSLESKLKHKTNELEQCKHIFKKSEQILKIEIEKIKEVSAECIRENNQLRKDIDRMAILLDNKEEELLALEKNISREDNKPRATQRQSRSQLR